MTARNDSAGYQDLNKDLGKVAGRVSVLENSFSGVATTLEKMDGRLAAMEIHSRAVCTAAKIAIFIMRVILPTIGVLIGIAIGIATLLDKFPFGS